MTIASATSRVSYTGNDTTDTYSYTFKIFTDDDLLVTVKSTATPPVETTLTKTTDYTVTGVGETAGGTIVLVDTGSGWNGTGANLETGWTLVIRRKLDLLQSTDIRNQGSFYPETHENAFDKFVMMAQQQQDEIDRTCKNPETVTTSTFDPTLPTDIATASVVLATNSAGDGFEVGPTTSEISNAQTYATNAQDWATKTDGIVSSTDYSSKAWAIGGTGVTDTSGKGAAKEWAIETASTVDTSEYSAKEYAIGTQIRGAASGGSAKDWATYTAGTADNSGYSAKEWAVGTQTRGVASSGSAKDWATYTSSTVDDADYSAKEYAIGTQASTGGSAKNWAQQTGADVTGAAAGSMSSKEWAVGTLGRGVSGEGSSKDWATYTSGTVDNAGYSSKEWATGTQTRGAASGGSAKDWATYTSGTVDDTEYSAKYYSNLAATQASVMLFRDVSYKTNADSPVTVAVGDGGTLFSSDATSGNISYTLPEIATFTTTAAIAFFRTDASANTITLNRSATDTIGTGAATSLTLDYSNHGYILVPDTGASPDNWTVIPINPTTMYAPLTLPHESTPSNPASGYLKFYAKNDNKLYYLDSSGTELQVGSGASSGVNLADDGTFESTVENFDVYANTTPAATPEVSPGGTPTISVARVTSGTILRGSASVEFTKTAANSQGQSWYYSFTPEVSDQTHNLEVSFDYDIQDTDYTDGLIELFFKDVTGGTIHRIVPEALYAGEKMRYRGIVQVPDSCVSAEILWHVIGTEATAWTVRVDNLYIGPQKVGTVSAVTDPVAVTLTGNANLPNLNVATGWYSRVGKMMHFWGTIESAGTGGGAGDVAIDIPDNYVADTTEAPDATGTEAYAGSGTYYDGTNIRSVEVGLASSTTILFSRSSEAGTTSVTGTGTLGSSGNKLSFYCVIPIVGWGSNVTVANIDSQRKVSFYADESSAISLTDSAFTDMTFNDNVYDSHGGYNTSTGVYTIPESGDYFFFGNVGTESVAWVAGESIQARILAGANPIAYRRYIFPASVTQRGDIAVSNFFPNLVKGDQIKFQVYQDTGVAVNTQNSDDFMRWGGFKIQGPSQPLAGEKVVAIYNTNSGQTITASSVEIIDYEDKIIDSHSAVTTGASWKFTAPKTGYYAITATAQIAGADQKFNDLRIYKNGSIYMLLQRQGASQPGNDVVTPNAATLIQLDKGDYIDMRILNGDTSNRSLAASTSANEIQIISWG